MLLATNYPSLQAALNAIPATGDYVYAPSGTYQGPVTIPSDRAAGIVGDGWTTLITGGITGALQGQGAFRFEKFRLTGAIALSAPVAPVWASEGPIFRDLTLAGGIALTNIWLAQIENVINVGGTAAVALYGKCVGATIKKIVSYTSTFHTYGIDEVEGTVIEGGSAVGGVYGIVFDKTVVNPGPIIRGFHADVHVWGLKLHNCPQSHVEGCLLYKTTQSNSDYYAMLLTNVSDSTFSGNKSRGTGIAGLSKGIIFGSGDNCRFIGNSSQDHPECLVLQQWTANSIAIGNGKTVNEGINNILIGNQP